MDKATFDEVWDSIWDVAKPPVTREHFTYQGGGFAQQDEEELWKLVERVNLIKPQKILEIGCAAGGTLLVWQALAPKVVSVDIEGLQGAIDPSRFTSVEFILGDSHSEDILQKTTTHAPFDFLFIDGDHETEGVLADFDMYSPLVRVGGLVAFHDYRLESVRAAIDRIDKPKELIVYSHFGIAVIVM
jgi:cephalosporin hydroxylase